MPRWLINPPIYIRGDLDDILASSNTALHQKDSSAFTLFGTSTPQCCGLTEISRRSPRKSIYFVIEIYICIQPKYPNMTYLNFERSFIGRFPHNERFGSTWTDTSNALHRRIAQKDSLYQVYLTCLNGICGRTKKSLCGSFVTSKVVVHVPAKQ